MPFVAAGGVLRDLGGPRKAEKGAPREIEGRQKIICKIFAIAISLMKFIKLCSLLLAQLARFCASFATHRNRLLAQSPFSLLRFFS